MPMAKKLPAKGIGLEQVAGEDHRLRADDRRGDAAGQHPGDGAGAEGRAADVGGGKAVLLGEGGGEADGQQAEGEEREGTDEHGIAGDEAAEDGDARPRQEAGPAADPAHQQGGGDGAERHADVEAAHRQGGQRLVGIEQIAAGKPAERDVDRRDGAAEGRRRGQQQGVAPRVPGLAGDQVGLAVVMAAT